MLKAKLNTLLKKNYINPYLLSILKGKLFYLYNILDRLITCLINGKLQNCNL